MSNREEFEKYEFSKKPEASKELMFQRFTSDDLGIDEQGYVGKYYNSFMQEKWELWQARVPEGYKLVPCNPTEEMWGGLARHLVKYMQSHDRYCPKTLGKYINRFIGFKNIPDWLNKEIPDWESDHAFATADLGVFIYKAMIEAVEK